MVLSIIIVGSLVNGCTGFLPSSSPESGNLQTDEVSRGSVEAVVDATGVVYTNQSGNLTWEASGIVENVSVEQGEQVEVGQVLATLEKSSLPQNIVQAEQELMNAQQALEDLYDEAELAAAKAELELAKTRQELEDAEYDYTLNQPGNRATPEELKKAKAELTIAEKRLKNKRKRLNNASGKIANAQAQIQLTNAINQYQSAVWYLNWLQEGADETEMAVFEGELNVAEANHEMAKREFERVKDGPTSEDIDLAETRIDAAQVTLKKQNLTAPFGGTITNVNIQPGDPVTAGTQAFRLDDLQRILVDVEVSEIDINRIATGQRVRLRFDAVPNREYQGKVVKISPVGYEDQGVVIFKVTVELINPDNDVKSGMTAAATILVNRVEDALLVPNRAIRWEDGQQIIYLAPNQESTDENLRKVQVKLGASSEEYSEVLKGDVEPGDLVVLNPPSDAEQSNFGPQQGGNPFE